MISEDNLLELKEEDRRAQYGGAICEPEDCEDCGCSEMEYSESQQAYVCPDCGSVQ